MRIIVTAGGTGGHIMPAIAVAQAVRELSPETEILFIGTTRGMEERVCATEGIDFLAIEARGIKGKSISTLPSAVEINIRAFARALAIVRDFGPDEVIGFGGYVTGMVVLAAKILGCRCSIHEQNTVPGLTNRILGRIAGRVFLAFPDTNRSFNPEKTRLVGNPVRREIADIERTGGSLLVTGGSLGASSLNKAVTGAVEILRREGVSIPVIHQTGRNDLPKVEEAYRASGVNVEVFDFIEDMAGAYKSASLVVCRAGGLSLAELSAAGIPAIMIPFPHATDDHQMKNAQYVSSHGGGWIIPDERLSPGELAGTITSRLNDKEGLERASRKMKDLGLGHGAMTIAKEILKCLKV